MGWTIGVDFGHSLSSAVILPESESNPRPVMFSNDKGEISGALPTVVSYPRLARPHVGGQPLTWVPSVPNRVLYGFKRLLGCAYTDPQVQDVVSSLGWCAVAGPDGEIAAQLDDDSAPLSLRDAATEILRHMLDATLATAPGKADRVAIAVPACSMPAQVEAVLSAASQAGWPEPHSCSQPLALAAALANLGRFVDQLLAMCDLGGGKFEASVVEFGAPGTFRLLSSRGESLLGGDDLEDRVVEDVLAKLSEDLGLDLANSSLMRLRVLAELRAMRTSLERHGEVELQLPFLKLKADGAPLHARVALTRERHDTLMMGLLTRIEDTCRTALEQAGIDRYDTRGNVVVTEGYAALHAYRQAIERGFGAPRYVLKKHLVAYGAALLAQDMDKQE